MTTFAFDAHTAVLDDIIGPWQAPVGEELSGFGGMHGGYLAALALRAMGRAVADHARVPRSLALHLLARVEPGTVDLFPRLEREGSTMSSVALRIEQDEQTVATALGSFGLGRDSLRHSPLEMPAVPAPEDCEPLIEKPVAEARAGLLVEHRPAGPPLPLTGGGLARILVWMRLGEDRPIDALSACMLADAGPPGLYGLLDRFVPMPSTDITVHFGDVEAAGASPWVLAAIRTGCAAEGYAVEDTRLWTPGGALVLQARQLRRVLS